VLPTGTPLGGPQQLQTGSGGKKAEAQSRRPLSDVTQLYGKGLCIGTMGGVFGLEMPPPGACAQEAVAMRAAAAEAAAEAAKVRRAAAKRQALRSMR
jgi:hypothetical protein